MTDKVLSWLTLHDPVLFTGPNGIHTPEVKDTLRMVAAANGSTEKAPSQATLTGAGASAAIATDKQAQALLKAKGPSDPGFLDLWNQDLVGGAMTLSEMARNAAGYQPQTLTNDSASAAAYQEYLRRIGSCPLFVLKMSDRLTITKQTSDWNTLIDAIADTFTGIANEDKNSIVSGLKQLAQAASSTMETTETENVFVQNAMNVDGVISFYLYNSTVSFYEKKGKGYDTKQSSYDVTRLRLEFQSKLWPQYAAAVAAKYTSSIDDWLNSNATSTAGTQPIPALNG
ncbi:hypothetical protein GXB81_01615 [Paraburkholderia sp. Ac-20336]|uniref:hypothetical protein n=1 Tax=Burkholderiaceae TaxID=119060 RepID=UPI0014212622|nr:MULTISPECIES: hypothetical protein [Burkholderiaceae]MBN3801760.1 hypothetical protein [Paraburkholderia sp. Ac-20336]MBN3845583.1 hypothetical protein [Paraburkholderia sp. Ac-20342]NIF51023.1 hypothetical protein [Burkholderia sp. Ax-1724]NIF75858.1 hypothetical protein [Paraburkholderia sp. Cy-641]